MYKSKKGWIVSGLTTATMMGMLFATTYTVNADSVQPAEIPSTDISNITEKKGSTENNDGYSVSVDHSALDEAVNNAKNAGVDITQGQTTSETVSAKDVNGAVSSIGSDYAKQTSTIEQATSEQITKNNAYDNDVKDSEQINVSNQDRIDKAAEELRNSGGSATYDSSKDTITKATINNYQDKKNEVTNATNDTVRQLEEATAQKKAENKVAGALNNTEELDKAVENAKQVLGENNVHKEDSIDRGNVNKDNADEISKKISDDYKNQVNNINNIIDEYKKNYSDYKKKIDEYRAKLNSNQITSSDILQLLQLGSEPEAVAEYSNVTDKVTTLTDLTADEIGKKLGVNGAGYNPKNIVFIAKSEGANIDGNVATITYSNLHHSYYKSTKISKIVATYSNVINNTSSEGDHGPQRSNLVIWANPYDGFWYNSASRVTVDYSYYDENGNIIDIRGDDASGGGAWITVGSLNSGNKRTEGVKLDSSGKAYGFYNSTVSVHDGNWLYSDEANEKFDGSVSASGKGLSQLITDDNKNWDDKLNTPLAYLGAGVFNVSGNNIKLTFTTDRTDATKFNGNTTWATISTTIVKDDSGIEVPAKPSVDYHYNAVAPSPENDTNIGYGYNKLTVEKPANEKAEYQYKELNVLHDDGNKSDWNVVDNKDNNIENKTVAAGDIFTYTVSPGDLKASTGDTKATREKIESYTIVDTLPKGVELIKWNVLNGNDEGDITSSWNYIFNEKENQIILTAKHNLIDSINADLTTDYKSPKLNLTVKAKDSGVKIENTALTYINGIESKTNTVVNKITKSEPNKKVTVSGNDADNTNTITNDVQDYNVTIDYTDFTDVALSDAIINNEFSFTDKMTISNGVATLNEDSLDLTTEDKAVIDPSLYTKEVSKTNTGYIIKFTWNDSRKALQTIAGKKLNLRYRLSVNDGVSGQVVNEISQNNFGVIYEGNVTHINVVDINPTKDVVDFIGSTNSLNGQTVPMGSTIYYKVVSSELPNNRSTVVNEWKISDPLDSKVKFNGEKEILAGADFYNADGTKIISKGDFITKYFNINMQMEDGKTIVTATPNEEFLKLTSLPKNREVAQKYELYIGATITTAGWSYNTANEVLNGDPDKTNTVKTFTFDPVVPKPVKDVALGETTTISPESIDGSLVAPGDTLTYVLKGQTLKPYHEKIESLSISDIFDKGVTYEGFKAYLNTTDGQQIDVTDLLSEQKDGNTLKWVAKAELLKMLHSDEYNTKNAVTPTVYAKVKVNKDLAEKIDNTYYVSINNKQGNSNIVTNTSTKPDPVKKDFDTDGNDIDGKKVLPESTNRYTLLWDLSQYRGIKASADAIQKGFYFVDDVNDQAFSDIDLSKVTFKTADSQDVSGIKVTRYSSISDAPKEIQDMLKANDITVDGSFIVYSAEDPQKFFERYVQTGTDINLSFDATLNSDFDGEYTNKAYEVDFGQAYQTNEVTNKVIKATPTKQALNGEGQNINDKNVARGDKLQYKIEWDLSDFKDFNVTKDQLAKGLSISDDYDENKLKITNADKQAFVVRDAQSNVVPTDLYTLTWDDQKGAWTLEAKDPLSLLETYGGQKLTISFFSTVSTDASGDIYNTAIQNNFGKNIETNQVVNHIPKMDPKKDINMSLDDNKSLDGSDIALGTVFNYVLESSTRPANYGGITEEWSYTDILDIGHDEYTGQFIVKAKFDFKLANGTVVKAGDDITKYFTATYDANTGEFKITATAEYLDSINLDVNKETEQGWIAYVQVRRIASGDVENTAVESYNNETVKTNTVTTHTPEPDKPVEPETPAEPDKPVEPETPAKPEMPQPAITSPQSVKVVDSKPRTPKESELPQMGDSEDPVLAYLGIALGAIGTLTYAGTRKKRYN